MLALADNCRVKRVLQCSVSKETMTWISFGHESKKESTQIDNSFELDIFSFQGRKLVKSWKVLHVQENIYV